MISQLQTAARTRNSEGAGHFGCEDFFSRFGDLKDLSEKEIFKMEREPKLVKMMVEQGVKFGNLRKAGCRKKAESVIRHKGMRGKREKVY